MGLPHEIHRPCSSAPEASVSLKPGSLWRTLLQNHPPNFLPLHPKATFLPFVGGTRWWFVQLSLAGPEPQVSECTHFAGKITAVR